MSVTAPAGFLAAGTACGIKPEGESDLALVATSGHRPVAAAGVFTTNKVAAAPVVVSRRHLVNGMAASVVLNSGNANAATGSEGRAASLASAEAVGAATGVDATDVLVCSTGLIGVPLAVERILAAVDGLVAELDSTQEAAARAADAILTTDTARKEATATVELAGSGEAGSGKTGSGKAGSGKAGSGKAGRVITVGAMAKGAAMLSPAHATMLAVLTTDAPVGSSLLGSLLADAVHGSFDRITTDGARSTNDTVLVLANGDAGGDEIVVGSPQAARLAEAFDDVCRSLAEQMVADAEGATKLVRVTVRGARTDSDALLGARAIAESQLVKCSWYGRDPYWGRVLSELGAGGIDLDPEGVDIAYGGITVCRDGVAAAHDTAALDMVMAERDLALDCDLHLGTGSATILTTDLTHAYVDENMGTS